MLDANRREFTSDVDAPDVVVLEGRRRGCVGNSGTTIESGLRRKLNGEPERGSPLRGSIGGRLCIDP